MSLNLPPVPDLHDPALAAALRHKIDRKTVPHGALGRLAALAERLGAILGTTEPRLDKPQLVVFAADHGIAARGVSAYPSDVTGQMVGNFVAGGAAVSVLARQHGIAQTVVDCGVRRDFDAAPGLHTAKIAPGTADCSVGPAMSAAQCGQALANGIELVKGLPGNALLLGEMGIGNTSPAALLTARLGGIDVAEVTGAGTGLDAAGIARKTAVLREALAANAGATAPLAVLAALGGFEIATMVGSVLQAASERRVVVVDGFIASAAVLVASKIAPHVLQRCVFAHRSDERGHARLLQLLGAEPLIDMGLRVGEGSGAALAWPLLVSACAILNEMASFESAGVSDKA
ncbi:MAG: nicotinate-nucleotide--dimethylbenzimidazole phosphoribosyltransferase [Ottowia sp.]|jgi:nicotinate-nucleotide--dimethylbenzimidazole phosphoribosyltransferase|uniref:nicotinate-nucleotide--dimethylbenzimidazole phosphoribosyltransferase n=1 Tax=Ottowia beijingensis TaxID=1207057 RepID=UPI001B534497|nr:nicotinate-nucleotide--dimethylbenzimidazole phosphoribosyltransferase [Ottowia sp.]MBP7537562.1 nicotinate-nucleotide--dimethylbenzimidazole phosphoribosyltransferase [Ottowia sp.]MBP9953875.1 nicotinate-nucleotide--dimethylbenzimidazole phosphoribosyltransferase [Ottowia sp.]HRL36701.1 nicotinate-nucleotide--dimethylbenzimidazole phosphoribosyltransferase [Ottowia beijingensis]